MKKKITLRQVKQAHLANQIGYLVTKAVDTMTPGVGEILAAHIVEDYCADRYYQVTIFPRTG